MGVLTSKEGDISSHCDKSNESQAETSNTSLKHLLVNNHDIAGKKSEFRGQLPIEHIFGFCQTFRKITRDIGFHLSFKIVYLQDINYTTLGDDFIVNFDKLFLIVPIIIPDAQSQMTFNDKNKST